MTENRVVIKINYDTDKRKEVIDPKLVTVWHTQRIIAGLSILILTFGLILWLFSGEEESVVADNKPNASVTATSLPTAPMETSSRPAQPATVATAINPLTLLKGEAIIFDKQVIRASLNITMKDNEPGQALLSKFEAAADKPQELFYFSEIRNGVGEVLFHQWLKDGRSIQKKQIDKRKSKFASKHTLTQKDVGRWQVQLIDKKGKIYSKADFNVVNQ